MIGLKASPIPREQHPSRVLPTAVRITPESPGSAPILPSLEIINLSTPKTPLSALQQRHRAIPFTIVILFSPQGGCSHATVLIDIAGQTVLIPSAPDRSMRAEIPSTSDENVWTIPPEDVLQAPAEGSVLIFRPDELWFAVGCPPARLVR